MRRLLAPLAVLLVAGACSNGVPANAIPTCPPEAGGDSLLLWAQAVPSAAYFPCIEGFPTGWLMGGQNVESDRAELWLDSDRAGLRAVTVLLTASCDTSDAVEVPPEADAVGMQRFEQPEALPPAFAGDRYYVFPGGCITYRFAFSPGGSSREVVEATDLLSFVSRQEGVESLDEVGLTLCGRGVDCPG